MAKFTALTVAEVDKLMALAVFKTLEKPEQVALLRIDQ